MRADGNKILRSIHFSRILLASAAAISTLSYQAMAQDIPGDQPGASTGQLEEVLVTARRRSENLQATPVAVTALSPAEIAQTNTRNFQDLRGLVPNLEITPLNSGGGLNLSVRGIGQTSTQVNVDAKVGFYLDDLYIARADGNALHFYDIDTLQVLKGPQGTLFGKNTLGGAVLLNTKRPGDEYGGYVDVRVGNYDRIDTEGAVNIPITDKILTRFSFRTENADGYITHKLDSGTSNNQDDKSGRIQIRVLPTDGLTVDLLGEYNELDDNGQPSIAVGCNPNASYQKNYNALHLVPFCTSYPSLNKQYEVYGGATLSIPTDSLITDKGIAGALSNQAGLTYGGHPSPFDKARVGTLNLRINYQINDELTIKSVTGFRRGVSNFYTAAEDVPNDIYSELDHTTTEQISQELDLSGNYFDGALTFVSGLYYINQVTRFSQNTGPDWIDPIGYSYNASNNFSSYAAFIQGTYKIFDDLALTLGARYNYDRKEAQSSVYLQRVFTGSCSTFQGAFTTGAACGGYATGNGAHNWYAFDPRAQLQYQVTPDIMTYVSATHGYESGGFNQQLGATLPGNSLIPYAREHIWDYEGGVKTEWLDHRLRVNVDGFYQQFSNYQATVILTYNGVTTRAIQNAASVHEDGVELEVEALPTPDLEIRANGAYLDQAYDQIGAGVTAFTLSSPVTSAPRFEGSIAVDYTFHLPSDATVVTDLNYRWVDSKPGCTSPVGACTAPAYGLLGGKITYNSPDGVWSAGLWGSNLTGKYYYYAINTLGTALANMGVGTVTPGQPREFGAEVKYNFGGASAAAETASAPYVPPPVVAPAVAHSYMVFFDFNKSDLTPQAANIVDQAAHNAGPAKVTKLEVTGHTDTAGSDAYNMRLSRRRAESVAAQLEKDGIPSSEIAIFAKGKHDLLVPTADGVKEPQNRRVQIVYSGEPAA
ncbi:MAG: hypothetical protein JWM91_1125 [Rhodospirillales bacterium]|nr:hypothetical protein [Rhodospirillales bacterium]